jgi:DNA polymerase elongation subunit (family B)
MAYVVDFDVVRKKDKEILKIYCRDNFSTEITEKELQEVPFLYKTKDENVLSNLTNASWKKLRNNIYLVKVKPKIARNLAKRFGLDISINELISFKCPKFSLLEKVGENLKIGQCSLEDKIEYFGREKVLTMDIENFSFNEEVYCLGLLYENKGIVYHTLAFNKNKIDNFDVVKVESEKEILENFSKEINSFDPYFLVLHWGQHDFRILQKLGFKLIRFRGKKERAREGMPTKVKFLGKNIADTSLIARAFLPELPNFKLETLAKYLLNVEIKKYEIEQLDEMAIKAKQNERVAEEIIRYNINDLVITKKIFDLFKEPLIKISLGFKRNIEDIVLGEKVENSFKIFRQTKAEMLYKNQSYGDLLIFTRREQNFLSKTDFNKIRKEVMDRILDKCFKQGLFNCYVIYPLFLQKIFYNLPKPLEFLKGKENFEKNIFAKAIDYFLAYPLFEYYFIKTQNLTNLDRWFGYAFMLDRESGIVAVDKKIQEIRENFRDIFNAIINYGKYIFIDYDIIDKDYYTAKKFWDLERQGFFNIVRRGVCYSLDKEKIVYYSNKLLFDEGFELSKKIPTRCELEQNMLVEFFYRLFEKGTRSAIWYVFEMARKIKDKEIDAELLAFKGNVNKKPYEYINKTFKAKIAEQTEGKYKLWLDKDNNLTDKKEFMSLEKYVEHIANLFDPIINPLYKNWKKELYGQIEIFGI